MGDVGKYYAPFALGVASGSWRGEWRLAGDVGECRALLAVEM